MFQIEKIRNHILVVVLSSLLALLYSNNNITGHILRRPKYYSIASFSNASDKGYIASEYGVICNAPGLIPLFLMNQSRVRKEYIKEYLLLQNSFCVLKNSAKQNEISPIFYSFDNYSFITNPVGGLYFESDYNNRSIKNSKGIVVEQKEEISNSRKVKFENIENDQIANTEATNPVPNNTEVYSYSIKITPEIISPYSIANFQTGTKDLIGFVPTSPTFSIRTTINKSKDSIYTKAFQVENINDSEYWLCTAFLNTIPNSQFSIDQYLISLKRTFTQRLPFGIMELYNTNVFDRFINSSNKHVQMGQFEKREYIPIGRMKKVTYLGYILNSIADNERNNIIRKSRMVNINQVLNNDKVEDKEETSFIKNNVELKDIYNEAKNITIARNEIKNTKAIQYNRGFINESVVNINFGRVELKTTIKREEGVVEESNEDEEKLEVERNAVVLTVIKRNKENTEVLYTVVLNADRRKDRDECNGISKCCTFM